MGRLMRGTSTLKLGDNTERPVLVISIIALLGHGYETPRNKNIKYTRKKKIKLNKREGITGTEPQALSHKRKQTQVGDAL
jgi:hypothetical protein